MVLGGIVGVAPAFQQGPELVGVDRLVGVHRPRGEIGKAQRRGQQEGAEKDHVSSARVRGFSHIPSNEVGFARHPARGSAGARPKGRDMSRREPSGSSRRQFITTTASAVAAATILPRHVLGGPGFVAPSDKVNVAIIGVGGQGRTNLRSLFQENDCQVIAIADPCEEWDLSPYYYGGQGRPGSGQGGDRRDVPRQDPELQVRRVRGLPRHAGEGEGDRRRPRSPRPTISTPTSPSSP